MDYRVVPPVKVDPLLADRRGREDEGPERRIECCPDLRKPGLFLVLSRAAEPQRIPAGKGDPLAVKVVDVGRTVGRLPQGDSAPRSPCQRDQPLVARRVHLGFTCQVVDVLVQQGLEPSVYAVTGRPPPVGFVCLVRRSGTKSDSSSFLDAPWSRTAAARASVKKSAPVPAGAPLPK